MSLKQKIQQKAKTLCDFAWNCGVCGKDFVESCRMPRQHQKLVSLDNVFAVLDEANRDVIQHLNDRPIYINQEWFKWETELESKLLKWFGSLAVLDGESETDKILKDKPLMEKIQQARLKGSKSSPYKSLVGEKREAKQC